MKNLHFQKRLTVFGILVLGSIILLRLACYNSYPFVYPDTGTYIRSGFEVFVPIDRPIFYGLFVRIVSFSTSLWNVVFVQSFILAYLVYLILKEFIGSTYFNFYYFFILTFLCLTTGVSFNVSMITPDIFTAFLFLIVFILYAMPDLNIFHKLILWILFIASILTHHSHLLLSIFIFGFFLVSIISKIYFKNLFQKFISKIYFKNLFQKFISKIYFKNLFHTKITPTYIN